MPKIYFYITNKKNIKEHEVYINKIISTDNNQKVLSQKTDIEECFICNYNLKKLKNKILNVVSDVRNDILLYRIFPNKENDFILTCFYENLDIQKDGDNFNIPENDEYKDIFLSGNKSLKKHVDVNYDIDQKAKKTIININV